VHEADRHRAPPAMAAGRLIPASHYFMLHVSPASRGLRRQRVVSGARQVQVSAVRDELGFGRRLATGQLIWRQRLQYIELVAIGVSHHHPADVPLPDIDPAGAECLQPGDLGGLVDGPEV
jgi:hypothetical protein